MEDLAAEFHPGFYRLLPFSSFSINFVALNVLSVFLPVESGEKIGLGMTLMLAQVVNLLILSSILPASSLHFPKLGKVTGMQKI